jgi:hypothetical protein
MGALLPMPGIAAIDVETSRPAINVDDLIRFASIGNPQLLSGEGSTLASTQPALFSPNGDLVAIVVRRGDPERVANRAEILVYRRNELFSRHANPMVIADFSTTTAFQPISLVRWLDSRKLIFAGTSRDSVSQVFRVDVSTGDVTQLSRETNQMTSFAIDSSASRLVTLSKPPHQPPVERSECNVAGCRIAARTLSGVQSGVDSGHLHLVVRSYDLRTSSSVALPRTEDFDPRFSFCEPELSGQISPGGTYGIRLCRLSDLAIPSWWEEYQVDPATRDCVARKNPRCFRLGVLLNLVTGEGNVLSPAPWPHPLRMPPPIWIDDGRAVVFAGVLESLEGTTGADRSQRANHLVVQIVDPVTLRITRAAQLRSEIVQVASASWNQGRGQLTLNVLGRGGVRLPTVVLRRTAESWEVGEGVAPHIMPNRGISLVVEQSMNDRPVLVALDHETERRHELLDPNPWLASRSIGHVETFEWRSTDSRQWIGGLYYPPNFDPQRRYPLVLQTHGFNNSEFALHGIARNFPGHALAAKGVLVLQVREALSDVENGPEEWPAVQAGYEAAIDSLVARGIADPARIGIIGWSRTGTQVAYTLSHSDRPFAAAALIDTADFGWFSYLATGARREQETYYGAAPFGEGLARWLEYSSTFSLDRIRAPLLMWNTRDHTKGWDWFSGLRRLESPVEYWFVPAGTHDVFQASQRAAMVGQLVDWFAFWLLGREDPDPSRAAQYSRWRGLAQQQILMEQRPRRPLLRWIATPIPDKERRRTSGALQ